MTLGRKARLCEGMGWAEGKRQAGTGKNGGRKMGALLINISFPDWDRWSLSAVLRGGPSAMPSVPSRQSYFAHSAGPRRPRLPDEENVLAGLRVTRQAVQDGPGLLGTAGQRRGTRCRQGEQSGRKRATVPSCKLLRLPCHRGGTVPWHCCRPSASSSSSAAAVVVEAAAEAAEHAGDARRRSSASTAIGAVMSSSSAGCASGGACLPPATHGRGAAWGERSAALGVASPRGP